MIYTKIAKNNKKNLKVYIKIDKKIINLFEKADLNENSGRL